MSGTAAETAIAGGIPLGRAGFSAVQASALKKAAWRFLPILTLAYIFNYLDRLAIGFAAPDMMAELSLTNTAFGLAAGYFSLTYTLCEVPSNLALYRFGAR